MAKSTGASVKRTYQVYIVFGTDWARAAANREWDCEDLKVQVLDFDTEAERTAYLHGVDDGCGWMEYYALDGTEKKSYQAWKKRQARKAQAPKG